MARYLNGFGADGKENEPWPLGTIAVENIPPVVDKKGNPIEIPEEKDYRWVGRR